MFIAFQISPFIQFFVSHTTLWHDYLQDFVSASSEIAGQAKSGLKEIFDFAASYISTDEAADKKLTSLSIPLLPFKELYIQDLDSEQIWAEIAAQQEAILPTLRSQIRDINKLGDKVSLPSKEKHLKTSSDPKNKKQTYDFSDSDDLSDEEDDNSEYGMDEEDGFSKGSDMSDDAGSLEDWDAEDDGQSGMSEEVEDSDNEEREKSQRKEKKKVKFEEDDGDDDMEAFLDEGDEYMRKVVAGEEFSDDDDSEEIDLNAPLEDSDDGSSDDDDVSTSDKLEKIKASGPRYEDIWGDVPPPKVGKSDDEDGASLDSDEEAFIDGGLGEDEDWDGREDGEDGEEDGTSSESERPLTSREKERRRIQEEVMELEEEAMAEKHWLMKGEVASTKRPMNSLLEAELEVQQAMKIAPTITVETSATLEEIIKQRIAEGSWDDPEERAPPKEAVEGAAPFELSTEKNKQGLGEEYAAAYAAAVLGANPLAEQHKKIEMEAEALRESLFQKLDALANFSFTPKAAGVGSALEVSQVSAITVEDVIPTAVSDAQLAAPEEVYEKQRGRDGVLRSKGEKSAAEREADRRARKTAARKEERRRAQEKKAIEKANPGLGNKYSKEKALAEIRGAKNVKEIGKSESSTSMGSSGGSATFFHKLQEEAQRSIAEQAGKKFVDGATTKKAPSLSAKLKL